MALSSDVCLEGMSNDGLTSSDGLLALLSGLEKLKAGRESCEPPTEYSEEREGERGNEWFMNGEAGGHDLEKLEFDESCLAGSES